MSIHSSIHALHTYQFTIPPHFSSPLRGLLRSPIETPRRRSFDFSCQSDDRLEGKKEPARLFIQTEHMIFQGKYSDGSSPADDWFKQGKMVKAYAVQSTGEKAKDPIFGLKMASSSQVSDDIFRWFCVESGSTDKPSVLLIHGFPSQAYSYRKVIPILANDYHVIAFDWLGFGFSEKTQPKYGFDYTMEERVASLGSLIDGLSVDKVSLVVQLTAKHANLPSSLSILATFCWVRYFPRIL